MIFAGLTIFSAWQVYRNRQLTAQATNGNDFQTEQRLMDEIVRTRAYALSLETRKLVWPEGMELLGVNEDQPQIPGYAGPRLVLLVDEVSCTTCRDDQTAFVLEVAAAAGTEVVQIVVHASEPRFARSYMRLNQIHMPVYYDAEGALFKANAITETPVLLLLDESNQIVSAHFPMPDKPLLSRPFHDRCRQIFAIPRN